MIKLVLYIDPREQDIQWLRKYNDSFDMVIKKGSGIELPSDENTYILEVNQGEEIVKLSINDLLEDRYAILIEYANGFVDYVPRLYRSSTTSDQFTILQDVVLKSKTKLELEPLSKIYDTKPINDYGFLSAEHWYGLLQQSERLRSNGLKEAAHILAKRAYDISPRFETVKNLQLYEDLYINIDPIYPMLSKYHQLTN